MKHLLLILAILMLGCGTDPVVVEEPPPVAEEPEPDTRVFVVYEIGPMERIKLLKHSQLRKERS